MAIQKILPGTGGDLYIPYSRRTGDASTVYFTRDLSAEGLRKIARRVNSVITGKTAVKLHTGEKNGPNIIPHDWVETHAVRGNMTFVPWKLAEYLSCRQIYLANI